MKPSFSSLFQQIYGDFVICFEIHVYFLASEDDKWVFLISKYHGQSQSEMKCRVPVMFSFCNSLRCTMCSLGQPLHMYTCRNQFPIKLGYLPFDKYGRGKTLLLYHESPEG